MIVKCLVSIKGQALKARQDEAKCSTMSSQKVPQQINAISQPPNFYVIVRINKRFSKVRTAPTSERDFSEPGEVSILHEPKSHHNVIIFFHIRKKENAYFYCRNFWKLCSTSSSWLQRTQRSSDSQSPKKVGVMACASVDGSRDLHHYQRRHGLQTYSGPGLISPSLPRAYDPVYTKPGGKNIK